METKYIIALVDENFGCPPVFVSRDVLVEKITPDIEKALVVAEEDLDDYVGKAQQLANKMMDDAFLPVEKARKVEIREINL